MSPTSSCKLEEYADVENSKSVIKSHRIIEGLSAITQESWSINRRKNMAKAPLLTLILLILCGCSSMSPRERSPAALGPSDSTCEGLARNLILEGTNTKQYQMSDFSHLDYSFIKDDEMLTQLVELHELSSNKEQSQIILALLKEKNPGSTNDELAKLYTHLLSDCSF